MRRARADSSSELSLGGWVASRIDPNSLQLKDQVVSINRVTKVVKGGKNMSFSALVVVGDAGGHVGYGAGKAREVPMAIRKGIEAAKKNLVKVNITNTSIPHAVLGRYGAARCCSSRRRKAPA